jgi:hypothetical protein
VSQRLCVRGPAPSQAICVETGAVLRVGPFIIARRYTYVLRADPLADLHAQLPPGLMRSERQTADPPDLVEIWFAR